MRGPRASGNAGIGDGGGEGGGVQVQAPVCILGFMVLPVMLVT